MCFAIRSCWHTVCVLFAYTKPHCVTQRLWAMRLHKDGLCCAHVTNHSLSVNPASLPCDPIRFHNKSRAHSGRAMPSVLWDPRDDLSLCASCTYTASGSVRYLLPSVTLSGPLYSFFYNVFINGKSSKLYTDWVVVAAGDIIRTFFFFCR